MDDILSLGCILKVSLAASSIALVGDLLVPAIFNAMQLPADRNFSMPDRIRYDGQCLTIDGKDMFIFSGSFHNFRCDKPRWRRRFKKNKQVIFNCIQTYISWNVHENIVPKSLSDISRSQLS